MIYFDNAATTFPKPMEVAAALLSGVTQPLGNPGRGVHEAALFSSDAVFAARQALSCLFGVSDERRVVFTKNATEALNTAIFGIVPQNGCVNVVTSVLEHNSVLRPLFALERAGRVRLHFFEPAADEQECVRRFLVACPDEVHLLVLTACANTTGLLLPIAELSRIARKRGARVVVDASQAAGHRNISLSGYGADYLCVPAHKGLYGVTGLGALLLGEDAPALKPWLYGGAGFDSERADMPEALPDRLEAGTLNVHGILALSAGLRFVEKRGEENLGAHLRELAAAFREGISSLGFQIYSPMESEIVLFNVGDLHSAQVSVFLNERGVCVRAGLHCAPLAHKFLGTSSRGAVRVSFGAFNTLGEVERTIDLLHELK